MSFMVQANARCELPSHSLGASGTQNKMRCYKNSVESHYSRVDREGEGAVERERFKIYTFMKCLNIISLGSWLYDSYYTIQADEISLPKKIH